MKVFLMFEDRDFSPPAFPSNEPALTQDLELNTLFDAMAQGDSFIWNVAKQTVLSGLGNDIPTILYRQQALQDCLKNPSVIKDLYAIAVDAIDKERKNYWGIFRDYPSAILHRSQDVLEMFVTTLRKLRATTDECASHFESKGFTRLFSMLQQELSDDYFAEVGDHLQRLRFRNGTHISASLGKGNKSTNFVLRRPWDKKQGWKEWLFERKPSYTLHLHPRDESGIKALSDLNDNGINLVANALAQSTDHILSFFKALRIELAFYVGCLNLHEQLARKGEPVCFPVPADATERRHSCQGLYDACLSLKLKQRAVGNETDADGKNLVVITGANQGGKSTFLRSIGLAQLMMQSGMFVPAQFFSANLCDRLFTHYKREEDTTMKSGKLDEELSRMNEIVDALTPTALVLFNESFAATNEREGSEIAGQIVRALLEKQIKSFFVTHLYEFAHSVFEHGSSEVLFLRAEREADGARTFKLIEREPLETSYGADLYRAIFAESETAISFAL
jgi:DNA mismatch repair ATPase MutS